MTTATALGLVLVSPVGVRIALTVSIPRDTRVVGVVLRTVTLAGSGVEATTGATRLAAPVVHRGAVPAPFALLLIERPGQGRIQLAALAAKPRRPVTARVHAQRHATHLFQGRAREIFTLSNKKPRKSLVLLGKTVPYLSIIIQHFINFVNTFYDIYSHL